MTPSRSPTPSAPQRTDRRAALAAIAAMFATAACGGGSSASAPSSTPPSSPLSPPPAPSPSPSPPPPAAPARLTLEGSTMRDPSGAAIVLRGMNEGTWGAMQSQDAGVIASNGANVVRVLIRWWGLYAQGVESRDDADPGHFLPDHVTQLLQNIQWCIEAGLWVVVAIDSNCGQSGLQDAPTIQYCDPGSSYPDGNNFWTDLGQRALFTQAWVYLAGLLKDLPNIAFYELLPEPLAGADASEAAPVSAFYQELMAAIESGTGDTRTPFLVGARNAYDIQLCDEAYISDPHWTNRVVYTGDLFVHTSQTQAQNLADLQTRLNALAAMKQNRGVPVFIQQYGVTTGADPNETYLAAGLAMMNAAGIGYAGWQWRQNTTDPSQYAVVLTDPSTGQDVYKTAVLETYASYWRA